ncbi:hypothetical protein GS506_14340 [Rhodococcus hoagii]|nr:hypothetical protein [Prescottella equi]
MSRGSRSRPSDPGNDDERQRAGGIVLRVAARRGSTSFARHRADVSATGTGSRWSS